MPPGFEFFQFLDGAPLFERADKTLNGTIPLRAYTYCEPLTTASSFGWHAGAPMDFGLRWDGTQTYFQVGSTGDWQKLTRFTPMALFEAWERFKPKSVEVFPFSVLTALREPGHVQVWTGLVARLPKNYSLLVRGLQNIPRTANYEVLEGVVESSWWHGPVFTVVKLCQTDIPFFFHAQRPFVTLQPVENRLLQNEFYQGTLVSQSLERVPEDLWRTYAEAVALHRPNGPPGGYKEACRARRKSEDSPASLDDSDPSTE
jgi:hypothetical protein